MSSMLKMLAMHILFAGWSLWTCQVLVFAGDPYSGENRDAAVDIQRVTLYRDQALVTRQIELSAGSANREITVADLPELLVSGSVYAEAIEPATIEAISVSPAPSGQQSPEIATIDNKTTELYQRREEIQSQLGVIKENEKLLTQLVSFSAKSGSADMNRGVLNAESLTELTLFSMQQRAKLAAEKLELEMKESALEDELDRLIEQRNRLSISSGKRNFHARIFVNAPADQVATIRLSYLVRGCGWNPQYIIRGQSGSDAIKLQYSAVVNQMTGENWENVELTLSTATPTASAARPILTPLRVSSTPVPQPDDDEDETFASASNLLADGQKMNRLTNLLRENRQRAEADASRSGSDSEARDLQLNVFAGQLQQLELTARSKSLRSLAIDASDDLASQTYSVAQRVSLDSRRQQQLIQVLETDLKGEQYHVATPLLSSFAYRQARVTNTQPVGLLTGPASVYLDGRFVGRIEIPATASGQKLTIGFGIDSQIRTRRELVEKTDSLKGGNRQINLEFRLVISNFKNEPAVVRLVDRIPLTTETQALSVGLESSQHPLSDDPLYCRILKPMGIVRWDLDVPAQKIGAEAMDVQYRYSLEFDRSRLPTTQHSLDEIVADYEESVGRGRGGGGFGGGGVFFD